MNVEFFEFSPEEAAALGYLPTLSQQFKTVAVRQAILSPSERAFFSNRSDFLDASFVTKFLKECSTSQITDILASFKTKVSASVKAKLAIVKTTHNLTETEVNNMRSTLSQIYFAYFIGAYLYRQFAAHKVNPEFAASKTASNQMLFQIRQELFPMETFALQHGLSFDLKAISTIVEAMVPLPKATRGKSQSQFQ